MTMYFIDERLRFIATHVSTHGHINRRDLTDKFEISIPSASNDLRKAMARWPKLMAYNRSARRYERLAATAVESLDATLGYILKFDLGIDLGGQSIAIDHAKEEAPMPETDTAAPAADDGWDWAVVEIFGHRSHAGRYREEERFGTKMLRIDVPTDGDPAAKGWKTHYYGGGSIFSLTPTVEATALRMNRPYAPPSRTSLPFYDEDAGDEEI